MSKSLKQFSLEAFVDQCVRKNEELELLAEVQEDGEHIILNPSPDDLTSVYRLPKSAVRVLEDEICATTNGDEKKILCRVKIARSAPCLRLTASTAEDFFGLRAGAEMLNLRTVTLSASVAFRANGEGNLSFNGNTVPCLGNPTIRYARDLTVTGQLGTDKFPRKFSNEFGVWMDFAILIMGLRGIYIHEGPPTITENGGAPSAGCIHVAPTYARQFYDFVSARTRITISYPW